jgi:chromosome segregation ATPase
MRTVEELEAALETLTRERDLSLAAWEAAGMTGRTAQSAMLELARWLEEARAEVERLTDERDELLVRVAEQGAELRATREAYRDAYRRGAEAMREACANAFAEYEGAGLAAQILAIELPEGP